MTMTLEEMRQAILEEQLAGERERTEWFKDSQARDKRNDAEAAATHRTWLAAVAMEGLLASNFGGNTDTILAAWNLADLFIAEEKRREELAKGAGGGE